MNAHAPRGRVSRRRSSVRVDPVEGEIDLSCPPHLNSVRPSRTPVRPRSHGF